MNDKPAKPTIEMVTLKQLCAELKVDPREARERLRLAVRDAKKNPRARKVAQARAHVGVAEKLSRAEGGQNGACSLRHNSSAARRGCMAQLAWSEISALCFRQMRPEKSRQPAQANRPIAASRSSRLEIRTRADQPAQRWVG